MITPCMDIAVPSDTVPGTCLSGRTMSHGFDASAPTSAARTWTWAREGLIAFLQPMRFLDLPITGLRLVAGPHHYRLGIRGLHESGSADRSSK